MSGTGTREAHNDFPCIDGLRAFAACAVVLCHTVGVSSLINTTAGAYLAGLRAGVQIFFVISGFVLYRPFAQAHRTGNRGPRLGAYFRRRFLRIFPAYWIVLTVGFLLGVIELYGATSTIENYFLVQGYFDQPTVVGHSLLFIGLAPAWTLVAEVSFYVFLPFYAIAVWRVGRHRPVSTELVGLALLLAVGMTGTFLMTYGPTSRAIGVLPANLTPFALGMALAVAKTHVKLGSRTWRWTEHGFGTPWKAWLVAAVAFSATVWAIHYPAVLGYFSIPAATQLSYVCLIDIMGLFVVLPAVFGDQSRGAGRHVLKAGPIVFLGIISYGIYLWHVPVIDEANKLHLFGVSQGFPRFNFFEVSAFTLVVAGLIATASWFALEKPMIAFSHRHRLLPLGVGVRRRKTPTAATEAPPAPVAPLTPLTAGSVVALEPSTSD